MPEQIYPTCSTTNYYVVVRGDTIESIAAYFGVTTQQLLDNNYGIGDTIFEGQILCIPVSFPVIEIRVSRSDFKLEVLKEGIVDKSYPIISLSVPAGTYTVISKNLDLDQDFGARIIGLSSPDIYIRSRTVIPSFTGIKSIILDDANAAKLFNMTTVGTVVRIV